MKKFFFINSLLLFLFLYLFLLLLLLLLLLIKENEAGIPWFVEKKLIQYDIDKAQWMRPGEMMILDTQHIEFMDYTHYMSVNIIDKEDSVSLLPDNLNYNLISQHYNSNLIKSNFPSDEIISNIWIDYINPFVSFFSSSKWNV